MPVSPSTPPATARPLQACNRPLRSLLMCALLLAPLLGHAAAADRHLLAGAVDSRVALWEAGRRIPLPGIIVSSETYMAVRDIADPSQPGGIRRELAFVDVHRSQPVGPAAGPAQRAMTRIALDGVIRSYEAGEPLADAELLERHELTGVISSEDRRIERVARGDGATGPVQGPSAFDRARVAAALLPSAFIHNLTSPDISAVLRQDSVDFEDSGSAGSTLAQLGARFDVQLEQTRWALDAVYNVDAAEYLDSDQTSGLSGFINHTLNADYLYRLSRRDSVQAAAYVRHWNDTRDRQVIEDFQATAAGAYQNRASGVRLGWQHGADRSRWRHTLSASADSARVDFDGGAGYEQQIRTLEANGVYRIRRRVSLLLDGQVGRFDYADQGADSSQTQVRSGVEVDFSRRLSARGSVGYARRSLDASGQDASALVYDADVSWQVRRRSTLTLDARRGFVEVFERAAPGDDQEAFGVQRFASLGWQHDWTSRLSSRTSVAWRDLEFRRGERGTEDVQFLASGDYQLSPDLRLSAQSAYTRSDDVIRGDYERWTFTLRLDLIRR